MTAVSNARIESNAMSGAPCDRTDDVFVTEAMNGDTSSFELLVRRYQGVILAIGRRMTGSFADAEDIAQQTFMRAFVRLSSFERRCSFSTWLTSIAINEARMWRRKRSRMHETADLNCDADGLVPRRLEVADPAPNPESIFSQQERGALLLSRMRELSPSSSVALEVCDLQETSTAAAAVLLGISPTALKSRRSRGRAALRSALAPYLS